MSAHFCNPFHHFIFNLLSLMAVECSCCYSPIHTTVKSFQEGQFNLCLTLWFGCLSAALSALQGHSSAPLTGESFAEKVSLAHQPDRDRAFTFFFPPSLGGGILNLNINSITRWLYQRNFCNTISSTSGSSIKNWKAIFYLYFVFH